VQASQRAIHLVVDKPFAADVQAAEMMIAAAQQANTLLTVFITDAGTVTF
jgi:predicted dehydrogenase